jgi:hypothetical protein
MLYKISSANCSRRAGIVFPFQKLGSNATSYYSLIVCGVTGLIQFILFSSLFILGKFLYILQFKMAHVDCY